MADLTTNELALELLRTERNILLEKTDKFIFIYQIILFLSQM